MMVVGLFDNQKRQFISPVDKRINVPQITKRNATVTNVLESTVMLMDSEDFSEIEVTLPTDEELKNKIVTLFNEGKGISIEYWIVMDQFRIEKVSEES